MDMRKPYYWLEPSTEHGLEHFYCERRTLADFRRGPLGRYFDGFALTLKKNGYSISTGRGILSTACVFNAYLMERGLSSATAVSEELVEPFLDVYLRDVRTTSQRYSPRGSALAQLRHLFFYLEALKVIVPPQPVPVVMPYSWILDPYVAYLREGRAVAPVTAKRHIAHTTAFLESLKDDVQRPRLQVLRAEQVEAQLMRHMKASKDNVRSLSSSLRCFLSYCAIHGHTQSDFSGLVPRQRQYRHAALPRGIEDSAIERVLAAIDKQTPNGVRDYAIVLLLMAYGIRAISACRLLLDDIDWQQAKIRFRAQKGGKEVVVPLLDAVAEAIIQWLRHRDPRTPYREVFLSTKAPHGPLASMAISTVVKHYMHKAGVHQPGRGAHTLRHSWAIRALEHDQPIKAIADALGHRYIDTTYIYAKADLKTLRQVAMPWPRR
jgi:integrase